MAATSSPPQKAQKCNLCLRYVLLPMCQAGQPNVHHFLSGWFRLFSSAIVVDYLLEPQPDHHLPVARRAGIQAVDVAEPARQSQAGRAGHRGRRIAGSGRGEHGAVEGVEELPTELQVEAFPEAEGAAQAQLFVGAALLPIIVIVRSRNSPLARSRILPRLRI